MRWGQLPQSQPQNRRRASLLLLLLLFDGQRVGAAVRVLEFVAVLGVEVALVAVVGDAVLIVVELRTAVGVLEAVGVLDVVDALVLRIGDAVLVVVRNIGTAVFVLVAVLGLRLERTGVAVVLHAIPVVVELGATVDVLVTIGVFGLGGTNVSSPAFSLAKVAETLATSDNVVQGNCLQSSNQTYGVIKLINRQNSDFQDFVNLEPANTYRNTEHPNQVITLRDVNGSVETIASPASWTEAACTQE